MDNYLEVTKCYEEQSLELHEQFLEMGRLKSDFDIEKFTVMREGKFLAHNFHFLMRQYSIGIHELRRILYDYRELKMDLEFYARQPGTHGKDHDGKHVYLEIEKAKIINKLESMEIDLVDHVGKCKGFEIARAFLVKLNNGKFTNKQYQAEEPGYWKWYLKRKALNQAKAAQTGIHEGVFENIDYLEEASLVTPEFQVKVYNSQGMLDLKEIEIEIAEARDKRLLPEG